MSGQINAASVTPAAVPSASQSPSFPEHFFIGSLEFRVEEGGGMAGRLGLYEVTVDGHSRMMSRQQLQDYLELFRPKHPAAEEAWNGDRLDAIGKCTLHGDDGVPWSERLAVYPSHGSPEPQRMGPGPGTGATEATPWDQRFVHTPTRYEQFQANMERNQQINLLNVGQVVVLEMAGRDHRPYLDQTAPLSNAALAVGGAYEHAAAQPVLSAPRPAVLPTPAQAGSGPRELVVGAGIGARHIPGSHFVEPTLEEQATYRLSLMEGREFALTEFRDGSYVPHIGEARSAQVVGSSEAVRTLHTHPMSQRALPSARDIETYGMACYRGDTVHEILGDKWPFTRELLQSWGHELPEPAPIKYSVTTAQVRAAGAVLVIVPVQD